MLYTIPPSLRSGAVFLLAVSALAWTPKPVEEDQLVFMPGSQPGSLGTEINTAEKCDNCHGGYDAAVEPAFNWRGSMMAQAARDPLWLACLAVAAQDSIWALGNPNAGDLCLRCHTPAGWLGGRSDPANLTGLSEMQADFEGVNCDSCHRMADPFSVLGQPDVPAETVAAGITAQAATESRDWNAILQYITGFSGAARYDEADHLPFNFEDGGWPHYIEAASGQYYMDPDTDKRGNRFDSEPKFHSVYYSRFHRSKTMCATCHDVSNPVLAQVLGALGIPEQQAAGSYFHVERTWSEFQLSDFAAIGGADTDPAYASRTGVAHAAKCQDCHMADTTGKASNKNTPIRSNLALHDQTGGNTWISRILASADQASPNYDPYNHAILSGSKYPGARISVAGLQNHGSELLAGEQRARDMLRSAAELELVADHSAAIRMRIRNLSAHKLISGFPEGRRMWLQVEFFDAEGQLIRTLNGYDPLVASTDGDGNRQYESGGILHADRQDLVYEAKMASSLTGEGETFHFVLATDRYKDNRIPPRGFAIGNAAARLVQPKWQGGDAPDYFSAEEYAGGYDEVEIAKPSGTAGWRASLYYQTTSREYVEFLRDECLGTADTLGETSPATGEPAYIIQTDPWFATIRDWGLAMYDLWLNNGGSPPELMAEFCGPPVMGQCSFDQTASHLRFLALEGREYRVQYSDDMGDGTWIDLGGEIHGDGTVHEIIDNDPLSSGRRFYRIESEIE